MKKRLLAILVTMMLLVSVSANFAFASGSEGDIDIGIKNSNDNTVTATGGDADQKQKQKQRQEQLQKQRQNQKQKQITTTTSNSGGNNYEDAKNFITASTLQNFVAAITAATPKGLKLLGCDFIVAELTVGQLKKMAEGASFMKKRGTFWYSVLTDDVEYSILGGKEIDLNDSTVVQIMVKAPTRVSGNSYLGEAEGVGRYGAPLGQILGAAALGLVKKTGATQILIYWDSIVDSLAMSNTLGIGAVGSATERNAGSVAIGAAGSTTYNLTSIAYHVKVQAFTGMEKSFFSCEAPAPEEPVVEQPQACDPSEYLRKLQKVEDEIFHCKLYGHNNLSKQLEAMRESLNVYLCTGKETYLEDAIQHGQMAELNYINGRDITNFSDSEKLIGEVEYWLASAFYARDNSISNYWKAPKYVVHVDKKRGNAKPVALTSYEKKQVEKIRSTLERYSKKLAL